MNPKVFSAIVVVHGIYKAAGIPELVITSMRDGKHKEGSKHYVGDAFDCRVWTIPEGQRVKVIGEIKIALGKEYDCLFEGDHYHIEYDPK